jgi:uncharacterized protein (DUF2235 family)
VGPARDVDFRKDRKEIMKKRIVVCCDGTWNEPETIEDDRKVPTNVLKTVRAVMPRDEENGVEQVVFYDQGVGTGALGGLDRIIGGGTGYGISRNIRDCYNFLANNYALGDDIFLFGFSRGAYTVRSLSGMLATVGLLTKNDLRYVPEAYAYYHSEPEERPQSPFYALLQDLERTVPKIRFVGVWDTVGALGVPTPVLGTVQKWVGKVWKQFKVGFHSCSLVDAVENAYQALAIDERRGPFRPAIWDQRSGQTNVQQVWFAGVHSNIGGGYPDRGLSDLAFTWMVNRAKECGLVMNEHYLATRVTADALGKLEDSYGTGYKVLEYVNVKPYVRPIGQNLKLGEMIHESVVRRVRESMPPYRPRNLVGPDGELLTVHDQARECVEIDGVRVPIYKERPQLRRLADNVEAMITVKGQGSKNCQVIDFTRAGGARLRVDDPVDVGAELWLDSPLTGAHESMVVWCRDDEIGVRYVA